MPSMDPETRAAAAQANFLKGYNCAQSLTLAFADLIDLDEATLMKLACSFGGGMGRLREVCGAVSGMLMIAGLLYGYSGPQTGSLKAEQYARVQLLAHTFEQQNGSIVCRSLLGLDHRQDVPVPEARTEAYYQKRPCRALIGSAARVLAEFIAQNPPDPV